MHHQTQQHSTISGRHGLEQLIVDSILAILRLMPVSYAFEDNVLVFECKGRYMPAELWSTWEQAMLDPDCVADLECCLDVRSSVSLAKRSITDLRGITNWFTEQATQVNNRCAILTRPGVQFGLMRMASAWIEMKGIEVRVFTDRAKAIRWLVSFKGA